MSKKGEGPVQLGFFDSPLKYTRRRKEERSEETSQIKASISVQNLFIPRKYIGDPVMLVLYKRGTDVSHHGCGDRRQGEEYRSKILKDYERVDIYPIQEYYERYGRGEFELGQAR